MTSILASMNNPDYHGHIESGISTADLFQQFYDYDTSSYQEYDALTCITTELKSKNTMRGLHQIHSSSESKADLHAQASTLLRECIQDDTRTKSKITRAIEIIHENGLTGFGHLCRSLVYYPYYLYLYLEVHRNQDVLIDDDDLGAMFAMCIEYSPGKILSEDNTIFAQESLQHLIDYKGNRELEIKLLPKRYLINELLYNHIQTHGVQDHYYNSTTVMIAYEYPDLVIKKRSGKYTGYRDAYHILLYGSSFHLQSLILHWDLWKEPEIMNAARDYFDCHIETSPDEIMTQINNLTTLR